MSDKSQHSRINKTNALLFAAIVIIINCAFSTASIRDWADGLKNTHARAAIYPAAEKLHAIAARFHLTIAREIIRQDYFFAFRDRIFSKDTFITARKSVQETQPEHNVPAVPLYTTENPIDILLMGDSLANSITPAFRQLVKDNKAIRLEVEAYVSSTLTNPIYFDWAGQINPILNRKKIRHGKNYDIIVVLMGANDAQPINIKEWVLYFGTPDWHKEFTAREKKFFGVLSQNTSKIYLLGVPPMQQEGYRERMLRINDLYQTIATDFDMIEYFPLTPIIGSEAGAYTPTKIIDGKEEIVRMSDGVHFTYTGSMLVVNNLMTHIHSDFVINPEISERMP